MNDHQTVQDAKQEDIAALENLGIEPYGKRFDTTHTIGAAVEQFTQDMPARLAGRLMALRKHGKTIFGDIKDAAGTIQVFLNNKVMDETSYDLVPHISVGDFIGVEGTLFTTKTGEKSIAVKILTVLSKSMRPLPEKWHGLKDVETRYRHRYLDLITNTDSFEVFKLRSRMIKMIREFFDTKDYMEVETPMMQPIAGGAAAKPFVTHHDALHTNLYLRIAPELYLKRLLVGGMDRVYEINRNFRNEGLSRRHNPEFTMLEAYAAYKDYEYMMDMTEELITSLAKVIQPIQEQEHPVNWLKQPWKRVSIHNAVREKIQTDISENSLKTAAKKFKIDIKDCTTEDEILQELFDTLVEPELIDPTFITDYPASLCTLAKTKKGNPALAERFELFAGGMELANAYSELNNPNLQLELFEKQIRNARHEISEIDYEYINALEHGMPPAGGLGIGIDRLVMLLCGLDCIRDVILFPQLKPEQQ